MKLGWILVARFAPQTYKRKVAPVLESEIKRIFEDNTVEISNNQLMWTKLFLAHAAFGKSAEGMTDPQGKGPWVISLIYGTVNLSMLNAYEVC